MLILTIDTALRNCNVVLAKGAEIIQAISLGDEIRHSSRVLEAVEQLMVLAQVEPENLTGLAVTTGPGSFTGLRIGMSTVKGLAFALNKPVAGLCVLETLANQVELKADETLTVLIDGSKQEVFARSYRLLAGVITPVTDYVNLSYQLAAEYLGEKAVITGNGVTLIEPFIAEAAPVKKMPAAQGVIANTTLAKLAHLKYVNGDILDGGAVVPNYIRKSDAEIHFSPPK